MKIFNSVEKEKKHLATIKSQKDIDKLGIYGVISRENEVYSNIYDIRIKIARPYREASIMMPKTLILYMTSYNSDLPMSNCQTATLSNVDALAYRDDVDITSALLECIRSLPRYQAKNQLLFDVSLEHHLDIMGKLKRSDIEVVFETKYINKTGVSMVMVLLDIFPNSVVSATGESLDEYDEDDYTEDDDYSKEHYEQVYEEAYKRRE